MKFWTKFVTLDRRKMTFFDDVFVVSLAINIVQCNIAIIQDSGLSK